MIANTAFQGTTSRGSYVDFMSSLPTALPRGFLTIHYCACPPLETTLRLHHGPRCRCGASFLGKTTRRTT
eukprot:9200967-Pyramimonas_sp.AAC.1